MPDPKDGKALALDTLVTHPVHMQVMKDIDAKFGRAADA
jgi:hypothetical protein